MGTASTVLLFSDAALVAVTALVAIVIVALVVLGLVFLRPMVAAPSVAQPGPAAIPQPQAPQPQSLPRTQIARSMPGGKTLEIDVPTKHVDEFMSALRASGWRVHETGEVVATDDDEEGLTTILVDVPHASNRAATGEEIR